jgi:hypothetical protein
MRSKTLSAFAIAIGLVSAAAANVSAQGISVTPLIGGYIPAGSLGELQSGAQNAELKREATLGLGANIEFGRLRLSGAYASGATLSEDGVTGESSVGDGSVLSLAADLVFRPLPKLIIVQPYIFGGAGLKNENYSFDQGVDPGNFKDESDLTAHFGVGLDLSLGPLNLVAEVSDFLSQNVDDDWKNHDAFAMVGLKFRLF